jgi:hypothetical protein
MIYVQTKPARSFVFDDAFSDEDHEMIDRLISRGYTVEGEMAPTAAVCILLQSDAEYIQRLAICGQIEHARRLALDIIGEQIGIRL